jgi:hypothetical protein
METFRFEAIDRQFGDHACVWQGVDDATHAVGKFQESVTQLLRRHSPIVDNTSIGRATSALRNLQFAIFILQFAIS